MRTLHFGLHVSDIDRSLAFYTAVGYDVVGSVPETPIGKLTMIKFPDDPFVTIELVSDAGGGDVRARDGAFSHFVIQVASLDDTIAQLDANGLRPDPPGSPEHSNDIRTTWITDPDGYRIELVQWPDGHPDGMTSADWPD